METRERFRIVKRLLNNIFDNLFFKERGKWWLSGGFHIDLKLQARCITCNQSIWMSEEQIIDEERRQRYGYNSAIRCACIQGTYTSRARDEEEYQQFLKDRYE